MREIGAVDEDGDGLGPEAGDDEENDKGDEDAAGDAVEADGRFVERLGPIHRLDRPEIIIEGGDGGEDDEAEQGVESAVPGDKDDEGLGDEATERRYAGERDEREGEGGGEER